MADLPDTHLRWPAPKGLDMANSFNSIATIRAGEHPFQIFRLGALESEGIDLARLPYSLKILLENLLRNEDDARREPVFRPVRQDFDAHLAGEAVEPPDAT